MIGQWYSCTFSGVQRGQQESSPPPASLGAHHPLGRASSRVAIDRGKAQRATTQPLHFTRLGHIQGQASLPTRQSHRDPRRNPIRLSKRASTPRSAVSLVPSSGPPWIPSRVRWSALPASRRLRDTPATENHVMVTVTSGANSNELAGLAGQTVSQIRAALASLFNIASDAVATVNGSKASGDTILNEGDELVFSRATAQKG